MLVLIGLVINSTDRIHYVSQSCQNETVNKGRAYSANSGMVNVNECVFSRMDIYDQNGGVFFVEGTAILRINSCIFSHCSSMFIGGCIFYENKQSGTSTFSKLCIYECSVNWGFGSFGCFITSNSQAMSFHLISMLMCESKIDESHGPFWLNGGINELISYNSTMNHALEESALVCIHSEKTIMKFSNIVNDEADGGSILFFSNNIEENGHHISFSNFVKNSFIKHENGIIYSNHSVLEVSDCIFLDNNALFLFHISPSSVLRISNSKYNHSGIFVYGDHFQKSVTSTVAATLENPFLNTYVCQAKVPFVSSITPIYSTQSKSSSNWGIYIFGGLIVMALATCVFVYLNHEKNKKLDQFYSFSDLI